MNRTLRKTGNVVIVLIVALLLNITYIQLVKSDAYRTDPNNRRILYEESSRQRGLITATQGVVLARSDASDDSYRYQRSYPGGPAFTDLTGYYSLRYSPTGIESAQNDLLAGESADLLADRVGDFLTGRDPRGGNVELTVLPEVQQRAYDLLTAKGLTGSVVALNPQTGAILAMVSTPGYDATPLASHNDATQRTAYNDLLNIETTGAPSPLINRATSALYPPGSTFKLVVTAAALSQGYTPETPLTGVARITLPGTEGATLSNFGGETCGNSGGQDVTMTTALAYSCNTAYADLAVSIGADALKRQAAALGVNDESYNIGLPNGDRVAGGLPVKGSGVGPIVDDAALAQTGIGQRDVAMTPLQSAVIAATIANNGVRMAPYLIAKTTGPDLATLSEAKFTTANASAIPAAVAAEMKQMMITTEETTFGAGQIEGLQIASKTGTSEHGTDPKNTPPHVSYVAFAPAANPTVAIAVFIENGGDQGLAATGSRVAAPIGREVLALAIASQR
ncbi:penicillin-binding protein 2 [Nakamurella antarctica]|uniref:Penicillin-binding protein 2 n=1 Tax=Nakamurella antarctica TaxID=1902245 RepID=A0A3G8ZHT5_9ACTN|nr:penicillin-binding protein 2 [Nakamurella antarctica]AZI56942.1 penicillin-binding protein 2 [Nakamurella antarctica]